MKTSTHKDVLNHVSKTSLVKKSNQANKRSISCHRMNCLLKVVCRCTVCSFYYCVKHVQTHIHPREELEIIRTHH